MSGNICDLGLLSGRGDASVGIVLRLRDVFDMRLVDNSRHLRGLLLLLLKPTVKCLMRLEVVLVMLVLLLVVFIWLLVIVVVVIILPHLMVVLD